jgi:hypothetical protein
MTKLTRKNMHLLNTQQKKYLPRLETLMSQMLSPLGVAIITPAQGISANVADICMFPAEDAMLETIVDVPKGVDRSNARIVTSGTLNVTASATMPWRSILKAGGSVSKFDLTTGPATREQQKAYVHGEDPVASPRSGVLHRRLEDGKLIFSVGYYLVDNEVRRFDVLWVPVKDAKSTLTFGKFPQQSPESSVQWCKVRAGDVIVEFDKPVKHQIAKVSKDGLPLMELNSPLALPANTASAIYDMTQAKINHASMIPLDAANGFNIYEMAYADELVEGITGTSWDASQVAMAAAGMLDSFVQVSPVLFPEDAAVVGTEIDGGRLVVTLDNGRTWSVPAVASVALECRDYQAMEEVGFWVTQQNQPLRAAVLTPDDIYAMLTSIAVSGGLVGELDDRTVVYAPAGVLGSLAIRDEDGNVKRFVGCHSGLWNPKLNAFTLPAAAYDDVWRLGSCEFDALEVSRKANKPKPKRRFEHRLQRNHR